MRLRPRTVPFDLFNPHEGWRLRILKVLDLLRICELFADAQTQQLLIHLLSLLLHVSQQVDRFFRVELDSVLVDIDSLAHELTLFEHVLHLASLADDHLRGRGHLALLTQNLKLGSDQLLKVLQLAGLVDRRLVASHD